MRAAFACLALTVVSTLAAHAQQYPDKPLKLIVADGPGSISDARARQVATRLGAALGQPVVVDNRPGGSMMIAAEVAARSAPEVGGNSPEEFAAFIRADRDRWKNAVEAARIEPN